MSSMDIAHAPRSWARVGGVLYLIIIVFGEAFVRNALVVWGDPSATAANIRASEFLWRFGVAGNLLHLSCAVVLTVILYALLRPVSRDIALMAAFFGLVSITMEAMAKLNLVAAMTSLSDAGHLRNFAPEQLNLLA